MRFWRRKSIRSKVQAVAVLLVTAGSVFTISGTAAATTYLPSIKIGTAALISPTDADGYYGGGTISTDGLSGLTNLPTPTPPEIVELARALKYDPDLIYQYVHNNIQTVWMYGLQKGALGAELDKSGTPFDQAELMIALLRQGPQPFAANYVAKTITPTAAQFQQWTGITNARAACQLLSGGGIPATINGSTDVACSTFNIKDSVTSLQIAHIWVKVTIPNSHAQGCSVSDVCYFDPSVKTYSWKTGIPLATAMQFTSGDPLNAALTGYDHGTDVSGAPWIKTLNTTGVNGLNPLLQGYASNLLSYFQANGLQGAQMEDIVGGSVIVPDYSVLRQSGIPYADPNAPYQHIWTPGADPARYNAVPDRYRTTFETNGLMKQYSGNNCPASWAQMFDPTFYVDEIYGRRLSVATDFTLVGIVVDGDPIENNVVTLLLDGKSLTNIPPYTNYANDCYGATRGLPARFQLSVSHAYAASADGTPTTHGDYMDASVDKNAVLITSLSIVYGFGDVSPDLFTKWSTEGFNEFLPKPKICFGELCSFVRTGSVGDFDREKTNADWLAQYTRAAQLNAAIAHSVIQLHHAIGLVYADNDVMGVQRYGWMYPSDYNIASSFDRIDVDSGISATSKTANAADRRGVLHAFAASAAALEGSISAQLADVVDPSSTATRFEWANDPPVDAKQNPRMLLSQRFYEFNSVTAGAASGLVKTEGYLVNDPGHGADNTDCPEQDGTAGFSDQPELSTTECKQWGNGLTAEIASYAGQGYDVVMPQEAFLGPGQRGGSIIPNVPNTYSHYPSKQRGGAFVATQYDPNCNLSQIECDPLQIAHIQVAQNPFVDNSFLFIKGGGGGTQVDTASTYNPANAADIVKSQFVDRSGALGVNLSNGSLGYTSPAQLRIGDGGFPYELAASMSWHPAQATHPPLSPTIPLPGWTPSWFNTLGVSGSGMEAMGRGDIRAAVGTIAAFVSAQDIYKTNLASPQREAAAVLAIAWWADLIQGNAVSVTVGGDTKQFVKLPNGQSIMPGTGFGQIVQNGTRTPFEYRCVGQNPKVPYAYSRGWDNSGVSFDVTGAHGDIQHFDNWTNPYDMVGGSDDACGQLKGYRLTSWTFPFSTQMSITLDYGDRYDPLQIDELHIERLIDVHNSIGRRINFDYEPDHPETLLGFDNNLMGPDARNVSIATDRSYMIDPAGVQTNFTLNTTGVLRPLNYSLLSQVQTTANPNQIDVEYDYDGLGRVEQVKDAEALNGGTRAPYNFYIADGTRGERDDPLGQPYTVYYDTYGHSSRYIDELGFETDALFDSRGRVARYVYPEGDCELFGYDNNNNTTSYQRIDKVSLCNPNAGSTHVLTVTATYNQVWNKPNQITNARNFTTNLNYYASGAGASLLETATRPMITEGRPVYTYAYTTDGKLDNVLDPDGIVTKQFYDSNDNLMKTVLDYGTGSGHLNLATQFDYDAQGDVKTTTDPRNFVTTTLHDNNRRKTEDDHHNGGLNDYLNAAELTKYDALGRDYEEDAGLTFSTSGTPAVLTWQMNKTTSYTPTSKVYQVTDADNRTVTDSYDDADRLYLVTDPLGRKTRFAYCNTSNANCAANQVRVEYRAWASGLNCTSGNTLQQCYRRLSYFPDGETRTIEDANDNITNYGYDGFIRLTGTTFPDSSFEQLTLDANGNVTQRRNRAAETLTYQYNALDWLTQKTSPNPAVTDYWTYLLNGRIDTLCDTADCSSGNTLDYNYDSAGRLDQVLTRIAGLFSANRSVSYTLDADGNRVQLTWPGDFSYAAGYCYDNLNRMTGVSENPSDASCNTGARLAAYTYSPLSRRTNLVYGAAGGNGAHVGYIYSPAGDLQNLDHNLAADADSPHYSFGYTDAHELQSETVNKSAYAWQPSTTSTTSYAAANNLNQYPSYTPPGIAPSPRPLSYDAKGNLTGGNLNGDALWAFGYDAENRMLSACKPVVTGFCTGSVNAAYAYDPLGRRTHKSGAGVSETFFYSDGDDEIAEYDGGKTPKAVYVPGPAIDEPVAMVTGFGGALAHEYFHTNHQGSVISMSNDNGGLVEGPFLYDPYGNCFKGSTACGSLANTVPYKFTGRRLDPETGLYYYRARMYSSGLGRFAQTDPVGYAADPNLYTYVGNDPTNRTDPSGNCIWDDCVLESFGLAFASGAVIDVGAQEFENYEAGRSLTNINWSEAGLAGASSAAASPFAHLAEAAAQKGLAELSNTPAGKEAIKLTGNFTAGAFSAGTEEYGKSGDIGKSLKAALEGGMRSAVAGRVAEKVAPGTGRAVAAGVGGGVEAAITAKESGARRTQQRFQHPGPNFSNRGDPARQPHLCTGSNIPTSNPGCP